MKLIKNSSEWHQLQIAKKTLKMAHEMINIFGGITIEEAKEIIKKYGKTS